MRILVTGANGMLGSDLCRIFSDKYEVMATDLSSRISVNKTKKICAEEMDVRNYDKIISTCKSFRPDFILHLAAETNVDGCESDIEGAYRTNTIGTKNIALACRKYDCIMVYISTGSVFDGKKNEPYIEFDTPNPQSIYSKSKFHGELMVQRLLDRFFIFRAGWMFGGGNEDKKFVAKILDLAKAKKELKIVDDKFGSPTYTKDLSKAIMSLLNSESYGLYHMVNTGCCSRYECAMKIFEYGEIKTCNLVPISSDEFPLPAPRPRMEALRNYHLELMGMDIMRPWEEALGEYVKEIM